MIKKSKDSDELKAHREMYVSQCNKFGGLNLGVGVHYSAGWNDASEILDAVAKLCNEAETEVLSSRKLIKQLTAENARLRAALEEIQQLTDPFSIEMAIKEALKGQP